MENAAPTPLTSAPVDGGPVANPFIPLPMPQRLWVPCIGYARDEPPAGRPVGTIVSRGESLVSRPSAQWHAALAPAEGRIAESAEVCLAEDRSVSSILFEPSANPSFADMRGATETRETSSARNLPFSGWIDRLRQLGLWADRWTSPDLLAQLHVCLRRPVDTVVCNILDVDPALPLQAQIAGTWPREVVAGVATFASLTGAGRAWLVVPSSLEAPIWGALRSAVEGTDVRLVPLRNDYPRANPVLLLHELTGRRLRPDQLPPEHGILLLDAAAALAAGRCFLHEEPMLDVPVALFHHAGLHAHYRTVPVGAALRDVLKSVEVGSDSIRLFAGTPLRQEAVDADCVIGGGELVFYSAPRTTGSNPDPCIRCAWCVEACPVRIQPAGLLEAAQRDDVRLGNEYGLEACIECGICSYVCPSQLPLLKGIRILRRERPRGSVTPA